jgi:uncharacterized membrane-anchored protein
VRDKKKLSRFHTKNLLHAQLRNFLARFESEVSVMEKRKLTRHERQVVAIVEQTLNALTQTDLTIAEILDAAAQSTQLQRSGATAIP